MAYIVHSLLWILYESIQSHHRKHLRPGACLVWFIALQQVFGVWKTLVFNLVNFLLLSYYHVKFFPYFVHLFLSFNHGIFPHFSIPPKGNHFSVCNGYSSVGGWRLHCFQSVLFCVWHWLVLPDNQVKLLILPLMLPWFPQSQQPVLNHTKSGINYCNSMPLMFLDFNCFSFPFGNVPAQSVILWHFNCSHSNLFLLVISAYRFPSSHFHSPRYQKNDHPIAQI